MPRQTTVVRDGASSLATTAVAFVPTMNGPPTACTPTAAAMSVRVYSSSTVNDPGISVREQQVAQLLVPAAASVGVFDHRVDQQIELRRVEPHELVAVAALERHAVELDRAHRL